jgi:short-subunit dehydrogenase
VGGAATVVGSVVPGMLERGHGTLLFTTGSGALHPSPQRAASAVTTAAETTYVQLLHEELAPHGVHAAQVVIVGPVGEGAQHEPAAVANELWRQHVTRDRTPTVLR